MCDRETEIEKPSISRATTLNLLKWINSTETMQISLIFFKCINAYISPFIIYWETLNNFDESKILWKSVDTMWTKVNISTPTIIESRALAF